MGAYKPTQLFGLIQNMDVTIMLFYGLTGARGQRSITSRMPDDHIIDKHRTKIQGTGVVPWPVMFLSGRPDNTVADQGLKCCTWS